jgi:hypothetical protein
MRQGKYLIIVPNFVTGIRSYFGYHIPRMKRFHRIKNTDEYFIFTVKDGKIVRYTETYDTSSTIWPKIKSVFYLQWWKVKNILQTL